MKTALNVSDLIQTEKNKKGIELTELLDTRKGWEKSYLKASSEDIELIVYLGKCDVEGDMFAVYLSGKYISIFRGHLNDGTY